MASRILFFVFVSQLALGQGGTIAVKREMVKPGTCRKFQERFGNQTECVDACVYDADCPGLTKCCDVGCGLRCVGGGFFLQLPSEDEKKSRLCPPAEMFAGRPCESRSIRCRSHAECVTDDALCCNDGCDTKCISRGSLLGKDGVCR